MRPTLGIIVCLLALPGCGIAQKKPVVDALMADDKTRKETIETVLRNLDEHPEHVDDVYRAARRHPTTLLRLEADAARDLKEPAFAQSTAAIVVREPTSVAEMMTATAPLMLDQPATLTAVNHAAAEHPATIVDIVKDDRPAMTALVGAFAKAAQKDEKARAALILAIQKNAPDIVKIVAREPTLLRDLIGPLFDALESNPEAHEALVGAVQAAAPQMVHVASQDPKLLAQITEAVLKASLHDPAALKQMLKKLLIE